MGKETRWSEMSVMVRKARLEDAAGIYVVEQESFSIPWSLSSIQHELAHSDLTMYYVLEDDSGTIAGYAGLWHVLDEGQITNIALLKAYRRQGYGELLLRVLMEEAWKKKCMNIFLEVRFSNIAAFALYQKLGYEVISVRKQYYSKPVEDAYVMGCKKEKYQQSGQ